MAENNKTRFFYVLYSYKTRVFDQSEHAYYPIYIIIFVSFILHHRKKGKHPNHTYLMKLYLAFSCSFFHSHEIKLVEAKWHKALCKSCMY